MTRAQRTFGLMLAMCVSTGACSTESAVQRNNDPSGSGGTTGSGTAGSTGAATTGGSGATTGATTGSGTGANTGTGDGGGTATTGEPTGGSNGASTGEGDDAGPPVACTPGPTVGSSVLLVGDSYLTTSSRAFGAELQRLAKAAGALAQSDSYKDVSVGGTQLAGFSLFPLIPTQYDGAKNSDGHIKTVVMDGGGNDILVGNRSCITTQPPPESAGCVKTVDDAMAAAKKMLAKMADEGVENVVYFFYPYLSGGGIGGDKAMTKQTLDYAYPLVRAACETAPVNCVFVDTRGVIGEAETDFDDGVHPTKPNIEKIAGKVWQTMVDSCIAQ